LSTLFIIPARGGSKGIKKKNIRLLAGKPLIYYAIDVAKKIASQNEVIVTSDDDEILEIAKLSGVIAYKRPSSLAGDEVPLDPVIIDAYKWYVERYNRPDLVVTLQPTSPLLSSETLEKAIKYMEQNAYDTVIAVHDATHLYWFKQNGKLSPLFPERKNRQWLPKLLKETGAFVISLSSNLDKGIRIGERMGIYEIPEEEAVDIDSHIDWLVAETLLKRVSMLFVVRAGMDIGLGHLYRSLVLAKEFFGNSIEFFLLDSDVKVASILENWGYKWYSGNLKELKERLGDSFRADVIVNDILDTSRDYVEYFLEKGIFVVNFEDLGEGAELAHLVFNALYERIDVPDNHKYGYRYVVLDDKFLIWPPNDFRKKVQTILITFGGVDQNNLTQRVLESIKDLIIENSIKVRIVLGLGYKRMDTLGKVIEEIRADGGQVDMYRNVSNMAKIMENVDLAITSNGRTLYELAAMRIPIISIAQNDRETLHVFARYNSGVKYLGISCNVGQEVIRNAVQSVISDVEYRYNMWKSLPYQDIRLGRDRVREEILTSYRRWKLNAYNNW